MCMSTTVKMPKAPPQPLMPELPPLPAIIPPAYEPGEKKYIPAPISVKTEDFGTGANSGAYQGKSENTSKKRKKTNVSSAQIDLKKGLSEEAGGINY